MTIIQLECFLHTAEQLSFTRAAEQMFISRQVVSAHVRALEEELGFPLFVRGGKSIELTGGGAVLFRQLHAMEKQFQLTVKEAAAQTEERQDISIGICEITEDWQSDLYAFAGLHPNCKIDVDVLPLRALEDGLVDGNFDLVLSLYDELSKAATVGYVTERLRPLQLVIAVSQKHPLARRESLSLSDLKDEKLCIISEEYSSRARPNLFGHFAKLGVWPREVQEFPNFRSLEITVGNGAGVCIALDVFLENRCSRLKLFPILQEAPPVHLAIAYKSGSGRMVKELADFLRKRNT